MTVWLTSDTHFGHRGIIRHCSRPFADVHEMDETLIHRWNSVVAPDDEVWHLGDFAWSSSDAASYFDRLNGRKHLVVGNHDSKNVLSLPWATVDDYRTIKHGDEHVVLFHYPIAEWDRAWHGSYHFYGHVHNNPHAARDSLMRRHRSMNVSVEMTDYAPIELGAAIRAAGVVGRPYSDEPDRVRSLVATLLDNDPGDAAADGVTVLDVWRREARTLLQGPLTAVISRDRMRSVNDRNRDSEAHGTP